MSILNITNLTNNPEDWIRNKYNNAFETLESELEISIDEKEKDDFIDNEISNLEEEADETRGGDLLALIDNYLVNRDYYYEVKEWHANK